ncbi:unnamed protein product, partial [Candidula unifasciata]
AALGPCAGDPCNGHGRCLETRSAAGTLVAMCLCDDGWTGTACSLADAGPQWSLWTEWTSCSVTCQRGWQVRKRECQDSNTLQTVNPTLCYGYAQEFAVCELQNCPALGAWGECSAHTSCGQGTKVRSRSCSNQGTPGVDRYCLGSSQKTAPCYSVACVGLLTLKGGVNPGEGRIELLDDIRNRWTLICANQMTKFIADLACRQAGWPGGYAAVKDGRFGKGNGQFGLSSINCVGTERSLAACQHNSWMQDTVCSDGSVVPGGVQCNVNGVWSLWSEWSGCSVTCENGTQTRTRKCDHPVRMYAGQNCKGPDLENKPCSLPMCPIAGVWNQWSDWSRCSVTCALGWQWRNRTCDGPYYSGAPCEGNSNETQACNPRPCPVDGFWKEWQSWAACSLTCGGGTRERTRQCNLGQYGGKNCTGNYSETEPCNQQNCPVDGVWASWSSWGTCSLTCGSGIQSRSRVCQGPYYGGANCTGLQENKQACNTQPCPVDGVFGEWTTWTTCTLTCGAGTQVRTRSCIGPYHGGRNCQGSFNETQKCNEQPCPIDGYYSEWSEWSPCTLSCGSGSQQRHRTCTPPLFGGTDCQGPASAVQACNTHHCPVDGFWLNWSPWSACNVTCGGGHQRRTRTCQEPQYGGLPCVGVSSEFLTCGEISCEIPGEWFPWSSWTLCTVTCGGGTRHRNRVCDMNSYKELTAPCLGEAQETVSCHTFDCLPLAHSCTELGERGFIDSVHAQIDPDGPDLSSLDPVTVFCDMVSHKGIRGHDQEERLRVQGYEGAMEFERVLTYNVSSFEHVVSVVDQSGHCEQYISWECYAALMHNSKDNNRMTGFKNRVFADYFGGAKPGSQGCACGMNHTCADPTFLCNCDSNDEVWRKDDGYLTYKEDLPVYSFVAGDTGGQEEEGFSQIGPLRCQGHAGSNPQAP